MFIFIRTSNAGLACEREVNSEWHARATRTEQMTTWSRLTLAALLLPRLQSKVTNLWKPKKFCCLLNKRGTKQQRGVIVWPPWGESLQQFVFHLLMAVREKAEGGGERERAQERKTRADGGEPLEGCIKFLWSYIILFKMVFFFLFVTFHSADQLFLLLTVPPSLFQPPSHSRVPFWHEREEKREIERVRVTASVRGKRNSPVALIYGGNAPQLVQTEAPSSLISELGDFEVSMWEHACVCVCACVL